MLITILTLFPEMFAGPFDSSIIQRAKEKGNISIDLVNIRDFATDKHKSVDDRPYGGGPGMVLRVDTIDRALTQAARHPSVIPAKMGIHLTATKKLDTRFHGDDNAGKRNMSHRVLLDPKGKKYNQLIARRFAKLDHLILVSGHYEGVDARVDELVDEKISIGDYVLTGGEIPAMVIVDSVVRLIPGVLKKPEATQRESFSDPSPVLEYPQYTRPESYEGMRVPDVLLSGNHKHIQLWQRAQARNRSGNRTTSP